MKRLDEVLNNQHNHYLYPFFWQKGQDLNDIEKYMDKMLEQGIYNFCIESRPHPEFLKQGWWNLLDFIIKKAKENNMKIWILDDAKFPTGYANGKVPDHLKKKYLFYRRFDFVGTNNYADINIEKFVTEREYFKDLRHQHDRFFKAILVVNDFSSKDAFDENSMIDVSDKYNHNTLHLFLEDKHYSLFVIYQTICGEETTQQYLDPMKKEATQILIDEVYEKHYQHYSHEFGKTITVFFSDEPRFGNIKGTEASIGRIKMPLPWNDEVYREIQKLDEYSEEKLIFLFLGDCLIAHQLRFGYMNIVSNLYRKNFSQYIGNWCHEKGIDYLGHVIEDNNAHARLGYGAGHYFRALDGQTMAGIDIIGGQIVPGMDYHHDAFNTGGSDGEFYHYALCKLGASCAKLDPKKQGRLMCEAFGAYGWIEGLKMMKWITDHMVSHGVNYIVPHAFNPSDFPDNDCPPHFYAQGMNPQYQYFHKWTNYADRLCYLMNGGYHPTKVGVLYHAFGEWSGDYMLIQKVLKELQQHQITCDVISEDYLIEADIVDYGYKINNYDYEVLVIPYVQRLPEYLLKKIILISQKAKVIFVNAFPDNFSECNKCQRIPLEYLFSLLIDYQIVKVTTLEKHLVVYPYIQDDGHIYMFFNEDLNHSIDTKVIIKDKNLVIYDAYTNKTYLLDGKSLDNKTEFNLHLEPYESLILVNGKANQEKMKKGDLFHEIKEAKVSFKEYNQQYFSKPKHQAIEYYLGNIYDKFSGQMKYEFDIYLSHLDIVLEISQASEIVEVICNGEKIETLIAPPYLFDISKFTVLGNNHLEIIITNNLARAIRDGFSIHIPMEPLGTTRYFTIYQLQNRTI